MTRLLFIVFFLQAFFTTFATAHEMRPAYLALRETNDGVFTALWKVPAMGDKRLSLYVRLPDGCVAGDEPVRMIEGNAYLERWTATCAGGLNTRPITIDGLSSTLTDALVRIEYLDGSTEVARLTPEAPGFIVAGSQTGWQVAQTYFRLGVDHILSGIDHLLFVLALILLIRDRWMLVKTITAFTVAHSITLAGAGLGYISLPQKPVEATIALSIAFVARELILRRPDTPRLSERYPWVVAFAFGLLHGFGFAGALKETGLPQTDIPLALLTFNLGVEVGQLMFVASVLILFRLIRAIAAFPAAPVRLASAYVIGGVAMMWVIERIGSFAA